MTTITFEARLNADGSLMLPQEAIGEPGFLPGDQVRVHIETTDNNEALCEPTALERALKTLTNRTPEQIAAAQAFAMKAYPPKRAVPPGKTLADVVSGKWPGQETDEQIRQALEDLS